MSVVTNVKVKFIRPLYDNLEEWSKDCGNTYIGRKAIVFINNNRYPKEDSYWCNPYKVSDKHYTLDDSLRLYKDYILKKLENNPGKILELRDKTLGCWCKPERCHGDILVELLDKYLKSSTF